MTRKEKEILKQYKNKIKNDVYFWANIHIKKDCNLLLNTYALAYKWVGLAQWRNNFLGSLSDYAEVEKKLYFREQEKGKLDKREYDKVLLRAIKRIKETEENSYRIHRKFLDKLRSGEKKAIRKRELFYPSVNEYIKDTVHFIKVNKLNKDWLPYITHWIISGWFDFPVKLSRKFNLTPKTIENLNAVILDDLKYNLERRMKRENPQYYSAFKEVCENILSPEDWGDQFIPSEYISRLFKSANRKISTSDIKSFCQAYHYDPHHQLTYYRFEKEIMKFVKYQKDIDSIITSSDNLRKLKYSYRKIIK